MLIMRNSLGGMIWQAYHVENDKEAKLLTATATKNGFRVEKEPTGYTEETSPGWRDTQGWKDYYEKYFPTSIWTQVWRLRNGRGIYISLQPAKKEGWEKWK